jgi:diguanylate cyclase (GGDEF)-like protein/PAS domain S-box-containing protein
VIDIVRPRIPIEELAVQAALQVVFDCISVGVAITLDDSRVIEVNNEFVALLGVDRIDALGVPLSALLGGETALPSAADHHWWDRTFVRPDGRHLWLRVTTRQVTGRNGRMLLNVHCIEDITEHKTLEAALRERALLDALTGLPNRYLFQDRLERALTRQAREGGEFAVLFVDLDGFKHVNDTAGHRAGDLVLCEAGRRILSCARGVDTVARWAGDEFVVLVESVSSLTDVELVAQRITAAFQVPFLVDERTFEVGASVGISLTCAPSTQTADRLLDLADRAMYANKLERREAARLAHPEAGPES